MFSRRNLLKALGPGARRILISAIVTFVAFALPGSIRIAVGQGGPPSAAGTVDFDKTFYTVDDTIEVSVVDTNAVGPFSVALTTLGGDSESLTLTASGANTFSGTINTAAGAANTGDGLMQ